MYDSELRDRLKAAHYTHREVASDLGFTESTLHNKLKGKTKFRKSELILLEQLLSERERQISLSSIEDDKK